MDEEKRGLERIQAYSGSHTIENLFNPLALRVVNNSRMLPTEEDKVQTAVLPLTLLESDASQAGATIKTKKCLRSNLALEEDEEATTKAAEVATRLAWPSASTAKAEKFLTSSSLILSASITHPMSPIALMPFER
ncbi:uncharacterized protein A4U43_C02F12110 [Asparagus officinalis]|uniref:Uncharacterized protein n=1 Tax=Asparagus officinalis TaxID=4686 RepID=A0A5P1FII1_ASPOF|nr:uncharacterized protein A4U43_C02F12110 [Asparagus officinalis]